MSETVDARTLSPPVHKVVLQGQWNDMQRQDLQRVMEEFLHRQREKQSIK